MKRWLMVSVLISLAWGLSAQASDAASTNNSPASGWDPRAFIIKNHAHEIGGVTTLALAGLTGIAGGTLAAGQTLGGKLPPVHGALAYSTIGAGALTLAMGLTAYSDRLDEIWPHAMFMGLAETGFILN